MSTDSADRTKTRHTWRFFRAGGFDQVRLDSGADLAALDELDQKLWVALGCPTRGLEFDARTLDLIDTDHDGRIRVPEIIAAAKWAAGLMKNPDDLLAGSPSLPLAAINDATPEGRQLLSSAHQILSDLGRKEAAAISLEETTDTAKIFSQTSFNGDGIIPADAAEDPAVRAVIEEVMACLGSEIDRSGKPGISQAKADQFFAEARAYADWWARAEGEAGVLPLGEATAAAEAAVAAVRTKIEDYFVRCRLAAFDPRALAALNRSESDYLEIAAADLTITAAEVAGFPLARVEAGRALPLEGDLNPAWDAAIARLRTDAVAPLLGDRDSLAESDWVALKGRLALFEAWSASKTGTDVEKLGLARIREILAGPAAESIAGLIARDKALEGEASAIASVDRLVRYNRDLHKLLLNFVSFRDFYGRRVKSVFQAGTLYLDQRSCDLCVRVDDMAKHGTMAHLSQLYLAYCDCTCKGSPEKMTIAAAFTRGSSDNLMVGRNGVFYDRKGQDWDATIVRIVENPVSIRQAFWMPYKRLIRWIGEQVAKRAAAAEAKAAERIQASAQAAGAAAITGAPPPPPVKSKIDVGVVAAMGVAVGGITAGMGYLLQVFFGLGWWMPLGLVALILLISLPSMVIAALKLRQRNLGPLLDASGWAVNSKAKINIPFGTSLTGIAALPPGSKRDLRDPYAERHTGRNTVIVIAVILAAAIALWHFGVFERVAPGVLPKSGWVKNREAAAAAPTPSAAPGAPKAEAPAPTPSAAPAATSAPSS